MGTPGAILLLLLPLPLLLSVAASAAALSVAVLVPAAAAVHTLLSVLPEVVGIGMVMTEGGRVRGAGTKPVVTETTKRTASSSSSGSAGREGRVIRLPVLGGDRGGWERRAWVVGHTHMGVVVVIPTNDVSQKCDAGHLARQAPIAPVLMG